MAINVSTILIDAPAQKVWDALTKPELVKQWQYGSDLITDWGIGHDIQFRTEWEGNVFEQWGKVLEIRANQLVRYSLFAPRPGLEDKPGNYFVMSYILTSENGMTRLEILQEDNRPGAVQEEPQRDGNPMLRALKELAEGDEIIGMPADCTITTIRVMNYTRELVFQAWTNPNYLKHWWGPRGFKNTFNEYNLHPDGKWSFIMHGPDGTDYPNECVFIKITEPEYLAWNHISQPEFTVVTTFEDIPEGKTKVVFNMIFKTAKECSRLKSFIGNKNEENFDRLALVLKKISG